MNINKHNVAMRWITRRRTNEVAGLYESFPGTFSAYQEALSSGFQGTMEEFIQHQSIPQSDRPFTGKIGGLVEPGVVHYGQLVQPGPGRQGYNGSARKGTSKWDIEELNKAAQHYEGKDYADLKTRKEKKLVAQNLGRNEGKFKYPTTFEKLSPEDQAKLKEAYPEFADAKFDEHKW